MLNVPFNILSRNYPKKKNVPRDALFHEIGWDDFLKNDAFNDTCAIRISLALIKSGVTIPGRMRINTGPYKGKLIEPGQGKLSHMLERESLLGKPVVFKQGEAESGIAGRSGIVSFFDLFPGIISQGHIDLVSGAEGGPVACGTECYWGSKTVWFWPLK